MTMTYEKLTPDNLGAYLKQAGIFFDPGANLSVEELSDGNINYVFRVTDDATGKSIIVKQAAPTMRSRPQNALSQDRIIFEMDSLRVMNEIMPGSVPEVYFYDKDMKCFCMEDCREYSLLRKRLMQYEIFPFLGKGISEYLARLHFFTSDFHAVPEEKKAQVKSFINPALCEITERLVYTEPFTDYLHKNTIPDELKEYVRENVYEDEELKAAVAEQKYLFMTGTQALLHGDLHTGSIFIKEDGFKAFDSEFAFYGPCSYDLACVVGNLLFSYLYTKVTNGPAAYRDWVIGCAQEVLDHYEECFRGLAAGEKTDLMLGNPAFVDKFLQQNTRDSLATAGIEMLRRTISVAKVAEIVQLPEDLIVPARRMAIDAGRELTLHPEKYNHHLEALFE